LPEKLKTKCNGFSPRGKERMTKLKRIEKAKNEIINEKEKH